MLPMANKSPMTYPSLQILIVMILGESLHSSGLSVDPVENLAVIDPGRLGLLEITWSPPSSLINRTDCSATYQLEYNDTYKGRWSAVRTVKTTYRAQFNLMKDVQIRVYTLLDGPCTNNTMIKSTVYAELIQKATSKGLEGTAAENFVCIFQNMEHLECKWNGSENTPAKSVQNLYFWHKSLEQAVECPKYIKTPKGCGCDFTGESLPRFTDINFSINGSSPQGKLKPLFITLQIQNQVKPAATQKLNLTTGPDRQLEIHWEDPVGKVPAHCLEWEVEHRHGDNRTIKSPTKHNSLTMTASYSGEDCFRVRSKLHKFCVDQSFWSEWSREVCHPEKIEATPEPDWDISTAYIYLAVGIIAVLMLCLCVWAAVRMVKLNKDQKLKSLLVLPFKRNPTIPDPQINKYKETCTRIII